MGYDVLENLKPFEYFKWFGEICKIPHGTGNEKQLVKFIENYAKERNFFYKTDKKGNVYMRVPASIGYEQVPPILIQAHLDMVCQSAEGVNFDFEKEPLNLIIKDGNLYADGTTLGADNGAGVAAMLAIGDSKDIAHPMLEFLFTVEEESGLHGIRQFDTSIIQSRRMINTDSGSSHQIGVSSLGSLAAKANKTFPVYTPDCTYAGIRIKLLGGLGGHAGLMAQKGRACAGDTIGEILSAISHFQLHLGFLKSYGAPILKQCDALVFVKKEHAESAINEIKTAFNNFAENYKITDPNIDVQVQQTDEICPIISKKDTLDIISLLKTVKTKPNKVVNSILITLSTVRGFFLDNGKFFFDFSVRSTDSNECETLYNSCITLAQNLGFNFECYNKYPGWKESENSPFRNKVSSIHEKLFGFEPEFERVLGGIEVSIIVDKIPDMDAVAITATKKDVHTPNEHIILSQTEDFWRWLLEIIKAK